MSGYLFEVVFDEDFSRQSEVCLTIGIVIPTYKAVTFLPRILPWLRERYPHIPVLVVDSSSNDGTVEYAKGYGAQTEVIAQSEFNHGLTREFARSRLGSDIVVMMTQDIIPVSEGLIELLTGPILQDVAAVTYARQIPHVGANFFEAFPRDFNYGPVGQVRCIADAQRLGSFTYFCSNSCAAWSTKALDRIGGFSAVLLGEDSVAVARLLRSGHKIAYVAEAVVRHSHRYGLMQEMRRHFDAGYERHRFQDLLLSDAGDERRGFEYVREMSRRLWQKRPLLLPYALIQVGYKFFGYFLGKHANRIPKKYWSFFSSQPYFWTSKIAIEHRLV